MKKRCELCSHWARMYCESDQASLCFDCDQQVHSANFLVAKHSRTLLCYRCQSPTPWIASGLDLGRAASVCINCVNDNSSRRRHLENCIDYDDVDDEEEVEGETEDDDEEDVDDEDAENQVVPWSSVASPPSGAACSSTSEEFSSSRFSSECFDSALKRKREDASLDSEDDDAGCSSEKINGKSRTELDDVTSSRSFRTVEVPDLRELEITIGDHGES